MDSAAISNQPIPEELICYELEKLMTNSIPRFHLTFMEGTIKEINDLNMDELHLKAPINIVEARINGFCRQDLEQQKALIRKAFQDYQTNITVHEMEPNYV